VSKAQKAPVKAKAHTKLIVKAIPVIPIKEIVASRVAVSKRNNHTVNLPARHK
jgi:hypothetical protein